MIKVTCKGFPSIPARYLFVRMSLVKDAPPYFFSNIVTAKLLIIEYVLPKSIIAAQESIDGRTEPFKLFAFVLIYTSETRSPLGKFLILAFENLSFLRGEAIEYLGPILSNDFLKSKHITSSVLII